jgi:hypothetical protein
MNMVHALVVAAAAAAAAAMPAQAGRRHGRYSC